MTAAPATAAWDRAAQPLAASDPARPAAPQAAVPVEAARGAFTGTVVLATGGTGGHVFPAEALAGALAARGARLALLTDARGRQWKGALASHPIHHLRAASPSGGMIRRLLGVADLAVGFLQALPILRRVRPAVVVGFGGYASVPTVLAARVLGVPSVLHEQNAVLGRANRLCAGGAAAIATAFAAVRHLTSGDARLRLVGNPVRDAVRRLRELPYRAPASGEPLCLVVIGGSQGAASFSEIIPQAVLTLPEELRARLSIVQQCRAEDLERVRETYRSAGVAAELATFFPDFPARLAGAHLVVARSGASTVAELSTSGRPSILVPFPHATEDHQRANAAALDEVGACILLPQERFTAAALASHMRALLGEPARLAQMADAARRAGHPDAAEHLAELVIAVARGRKDTR